MISALEVYLIGQIEEIKGLFLAGSTLFFIILIASLIMKGVITLLYLDSLTSEDTKVFLKKISDIIPLKTVFVCICILNAIAYLIPSTKTLAAMYIVPAVVNDERIQGITNNTLDKLLMMTDDWVKETLKETLTDEQKTDINL